MQRFAKEAALALMIVVVGAAVLYPMMARADVHEDPVKANMMTLGRAIIQYAYDNDETLPLAFGPRGPNMWRWNSRIEVPQGWQRENQTEAKTEADGMTWINATRRYYKNDAILAAPDLPVVKEPVNYEDATKPYATVGYSYNGLLHAYRLSEVAEPTRLPLLWQGLGLVNWQGFAMSNPTLSCIMPGPCHYGGEPMTSGVLFMLKDMNIQHDSQFWFLSTDLTAYPLLLNHNPEGNQDALRDPFATYTATGIAQAYWTSPGPGIGQYPRMFKPDSTLEAEARESGLMRVP